MRLLQLLAFVVLIFLLASCFGGGGGGGGGNSNPVNQAPVLTSPSAVSVAENQTAVQSVTGSDPEGASLVFSVIGGADSALFTIDGGTGVLSFVSPRDYELPSDAGANNVYEVAVQISDGSLTASQVVAVTVTDINESQVPSAVTIPAGIFTQGDQVGVGVSDERPLRQVTISQSFRLSTTEVTNSQYMTMLNWALDPNNDGNGADAYIELDDMVTPTTVRNVATDPRDGVTVWQQQELLDLDNASCQIVWDGGAFGIRDVAAHPDGGTGSRSDHPVVVVSWYGSQFFCWAQNVQAGASANPISLTDWGVDTALAGWRLPTEAEWEYAARGGWNGGAKYPWWTADSATHTEPDGTQCNRLGDGDPYESVAGDPRSTPVRRYAANGYGLFDMAGNVWEWCGDWYHIDAYDGLVADGVADEDGTSDGVDNDNQGDAVTDPVGPGVGFYRIVRGGSWGNAASSLRCAARIGSTPATGGYTVGFRPAYGLGAPVGSG